MRNEGCSRIKKLLVSKDKRKFNKSNKSCKIERWRPGLSLIKKRKRS